MLFEDCIWRNADDVNPPTAAVSVTYHDSIHTPGAPYAGLTIKDSTVESGTYVRAVAMTNIDRADFGANAASDGFEVNIEDCQFSRNAVGGQVVRLLYVTSGSILSTCFSGNAIDDKALVVADTGSSMMYSDLFGEDNTAPEWVCDDLDIMDYSLGVAHYTPTEMGSIFFNDCPEEGFIFDATSCPLEDPGVNPPTAPPPTARPPPTAPAPTTARPPPTVPAPLPTAPPPTTSLLVLPMTDRPPPTTGRGDCKVCPDGSTLTAPTRYSKRFGSTCQDLEARGMTFDEGSAECTNAQVISVLDCDCPYVPPALSPKDVSCTLCTDSFVPLPDLPLNPSDGSSTCGIFEWQAHSFQGQQCRAMQATAGAACGCDNPPTAPCKVTCTNKDSSFDVKKKLTDAVVGTVVWKGQWLCGEILWSESVDPNACNAKVKEDLRVLCCPDEPENTPAPLPTQPPSPASAAMSLVGRHLFWSLSSLAVGFSLIFV